MRRAVFRGLLVVMTAPLCVGCVSYGAYKGMQDELERTKSANRHLVDQYNRAVLEAKLATETQGIAGGVDPARYQDLKARFTQIEKELARVRQLNASFDPLDYKEIQGATPAENGGISLGANLLFNSGEAALKATQLPALDQMSDLLQRKYKGQTILIEGHTDNDPLKNTKRLYEFNLNLGYQRAYHVFKYLAEKHGIPESQFRIETYGFTKPVDPSIVDSAEGKRMNRRVVFRLSGHRI
jgi:flagellar motor protein MotB